MELSLGKNLKRIRKAKKITQRQLADGSGLSFSFISKLESGEQNNPTLDTIVKIADCLGVQSYELMGWDALSPIFAEIEADWETLKDRPVEFVYRVIQDLLNSEAGTEFFEINHGAISPDEMEGIISAIIDFTKYQFTKYKDKPSIYHKP
ncbi:MAG: helix-turn-helix transcriptional regulator [Clostridiales bacterium]|jgi:transcriptional regulator with XRE-family HTH domain|nr:helix-turn-helix transcriptional regulator [Clostridiales bacterium]